MSSIVLVGEMNPYGADPRFALYDEPPNSAGGRLRRKILDMSRRDYLALPRYNLCVDKWSLKNARARAAEIRSVNSDRVIVMLGRKVATAFGYEEMGAFGVATVRRVFDSNRFVALPRPSGRCLAWNDPDSIRRARALLLSLDPSLRVGASEVP